MEPLLYINGLYIDCKMNISCKDEHNKGQKWYGPKQKILRGGGNNI